MDHLNQLLKKKGGGGGGGGGEIEFADVDRRALREAPVKIKAFLLFFVKKSSKDNLLHGFENFLFHLKPQHFKESRQSH